MPKYRIDSVKIAGFKGFTDEQVIPLRAKTTFIFGQNGLGKSSIIEAIVWCLYGTESAVRNQFHKGTCSVDLFLSEIKDPARIWRVHRVLHQVDNQSDADAFTPENKRINISEFLPQLRKLEHGPGARVIFAEQEPGRRYSHDINNFEALIAAYLGLDEIYSLIDWLGKFVETQEIVSVDPVRARAKAVTEALNARISNIQVELNSINSQPPWEGTSPPSLRDTTSSASSLLGTVQTLLGEPMTPQSSEKLQDILDSIGNKLAQLEQVSQGQLENSTRDLETKVNRLTELRTIISQTSTELVTLETRSLQQAEEAKRILGTDTESGLAEQLKSLDAKTGRLLKSASLAREAQKVVTSDMTICPVCSAQYEPGQLHSHLEEILRSAEQSSGAAIQQVTAIKNRLEAIGRIKGEHNGTATAIGIANQKKSQAESEAMALMGQDPIDLSKIDLKLTEFGRSLQELTEKRVQGNVRVSSIKDQLDKLRRIGTYHRLLRSLSVIDEFKRSEPYASAESKLKELERTLHGLKEIRQHLEDAYVTAFSRYLPVLSREMTNVYRHLTHQKSFDSIRVLPEPGNPVNSTTHKMILQVGSAIRDRWVIPDPKSDVLNGQALSVLNLVPYFAFAKMGLSKHEVDFLLIDDPSQSFDTTHIEYLLELLGQVAEEAQIIIASHERDRIEAKLGHYFKDFGIIEVEDFSVEKGPVLAAPKLPRE